MTLERPCRPKTYRAPTWSWLSIDGTIGMMDHETTRERGYDLVEIQDARVFPVDRDPTGQLQDGFIILSGFIVNTRVLRFRDEASAHKMRAAWIDGISPDEKTRVNLVFDDRKQRDLDKVFLLPIRHWKSLFVTNIQGILTTQTRRRGTMGTFERVVWFHAYKLPGLRSKVDRRIRPETNI